MNFIKERSAFKNELVAQEGLVRPPNETIHEHLAVINAICEHDAEAAEELMRAHFKKSAAFLRRESAKSTEN